MTSAVSLFILETRLPTWRTHDSGSLGACLHPRGARAFLTQPRSRAQYLYFGVLASYIQLRLTRIQCSTFYSAPISLFQKIPSVSVDYTYIPFVSLHFFCFTAFSVSVHYQCFSTIPLLHCIPCFNILPLLLVFILKAFTYVHCRWCFLAPHEL